MIIKLIILPFYLILPFTLDWFGTSGYWFVPFLLWFTGIVANALVERFRERTS